MKKLILAGTMLMTAYPMTAYADTAVNGEKVQLSNNEKVKENSEMQQQSYKTNSSVPAFKERLYKGAVKDEHVLVVLMDFSDSPQSTLRRSETKNYRSNYSKKYYEQLFFGSSMKAQNGQTNETLKSYYRKASGNSLNLTGQVTGWYRAKHPLTYYGKADDKNADQLVMEAARYAAKDPKINMRDYDRYDYYDQDQDGKINEPDGLIDKLVVVYSGVGESQGGGRFGKSSIWEHVSEVGFTSAGMPQTISGTYSPTSKLYKNRLGVAEYGLLSEDSTIGTFAHEFGHMLGLIDEYDTETADNHAGEPVRYWSLMSYGADAGKIPGQHPVLMSPMARMDLQQIYGGNWVLGTELNYSQITKSGKEYLLDQASIKGVNNDLIKINLPPVKKKLKNNKTASFQQYYLVEWRSHNGLDKGLGEIYDPLGHNYYGKGMVIWYVNESYADNSNLIHHLGRSLVGVVDANPATIQTADGAIPISDTQIYDAAFNTKDYGNYNKGSDYYFKKKTKAVPLFSDKNYSTTAFNQLLLPEAGRILPQLGIKIKIVNQNSDGTVAKIKIYK